MKISLVKVRMIEDSPILKDAQYSPVVRLEEKVFRMLSKEYQHDLAEWGTGIEINCQESEVGTRTEAIVSNVISVMNEVLNE